MDGEQMRKLLADQIQKTTAQAENHLIAHCQALGAIKAFEWVKQQIPEALPEAKSGEPVDLTKTFPGCEVRKE
jgi:hypothetical protein